MRQAALNANFGGADFPGFACLLGHLLKAEKVGVRLARAAAEGAEFAADETDISEIDVAVDNVGDDVSDDLATQSVSRDEQTEEIVAVGVREQRALFASEHSAIERRHHLLERGARLTTDARSDVRPLQRGEVLQFGLGK